MIDKTYRKPLAMLSHSLSANVQILDFVTKVLIPNGFRRSALRQQVTNLET
jgi:hypothetical protein